MSEYHGPSEIGYANFPGRGTNYHAMFGGRQVEVALSPKLKNIRIHVDGVQWAPVAPAESDLTSHQPPRNATTVTSDTTARNTKQKPSNGRTRGTA